MLESFEPGCPLLGGLGGLLTCGGPLELVDNQRLRDLEGLELVSHVDGDLRLVENAGLTDVSGLWNVTSVGGGLSIIGNERLAPEFVEELITKIGAGRIEGEIEVRDNGP